MGRRAQALFAIATTLAVCGCRDDRPVGPTCPTLLPGWRTPDGGISGFHPKLLLGVADETPVLNGEPMSWASFDRALRIATDPSMQPEVQLMFDPSGARSCAAAIRVRDRIHTLGDCSRRLMKCAQGTEAAFREAAKRGVGGAWGIE